MGKSDALSRREDHAEGIEDDNKGVVVIILDKIRMTILIMDEGDSLKQKIFNATCLLSEADIQRLCKKNTICEECDGMLTDNLGRLYMPESNLLWMEVIQKHHDSLVAGHPGYEKTLDLLQCNYYWSRMATTVKEYVARCDMCQRFKGPNMTPAGLLHPLETLSSPWEHISGDFITDLPLSHSFDAILMVVDWFSKEVELIPCTKTCSALNTAKLFMHNMWKHHGLPHSITSDRGPQFAAQVMQEINKALSISTKLSTSFHPQTDGQTKIVNKEVQKFLWIYCFEKQDQWANWLPIAQFSINSKKHALIKVAPFKATQSYTLCMGIKPLPVNKAPAARDFTSEMEGTLESVRENLEKAKEQMKLNADKHHLAAPNYTIGQQVWLATKNLWLTHASCKLTERWLGPYTIISLAGPNAIKLKLPRSLQIHPVVNISWIKPYLGPMEGQTLYQPRPVHVTEDRDNKWEVDHIMDSHLKNKKLEYLVHWRGYDDLDCTWEPKSNLRNVKDAIHDFHESHSSTPHASSIDPADFFLLFQKQPEPFTEINPCHLPFDCLEVDL